MHEDPETRPDPEPPQFRIVGGAPPVEGGDAPSPSDGDLPRALAISLAVRDRLRAQALEWCKDRSWEVRVPFLIYFAYVLVQHWGNIEYASLIGGINFGIHELGHVVFRPFGEFMTVAGGTILQCLAPVIALGVFYKQRDFFAIGFCFAWFSTNCFHIATYCQDARGQLNLVLYSTAGQGFGKDGWGDWSRMLRWTGMLEWDQTIAFAWRVAANLSMAAFFALSLWLFWHMHTSRKTRGIE